MKQIYTLLAVVVLGVLGFLPASAATAKLVIGNIEIEPGQTVKVPVILEAPQDANASALQLDLTLPEGLSFQKIEDEGEEFEFLLSNSYLRSHSAQMSIYTPTSAKLIIYSSSNSNLIKSGNSATLGVFSIKAADDYKGSGTIKISDTVLATSGGEGGVNAGDAISMDVPEPDAFVPVTGISLSKSELNLLLGKEETLTVTFTPEAATGNPVEWNSSDEKVATVDADGKVTAVAVGGPVTITATSREQSATCKVTVTPVLVTKITLAGPASLVKGEKGQFTATIEPADATNKEITWSSSDEKVATIDQEGNVVAVAAGSTTITATAKDGSEVKGTVALSVVGVLVKSISLDITEKTLKVDETVTLKATINPDNADKKDVEWTSSDEEVATVDADGKVTAVGVGSATITATALGGTDVTATCAITVEPTPVEKITIAEPEEELIIGSTLQLTATVEPENATDKTLEWSSNEPTIATVDKNGKVTALAIGPVVITAKATDGSDIEGTITLEVKPVVWETLTLSITEYEMIVGEEVKMTVTGTPENVTDKTLKVTVEPEGIAEASEIDDKGNFTLKAIGEGDVTVTVKGVDGSEAEATATVKVNAELAITSSDEDLAEGSTITITANTYGEVEWSIEGEGAKIVKTYTNPAAVDVKGEKEGATIKVIAELADGSTQEIVFKITEAKDVNAESIVISPSTVTLNVGSSIGLTAIIAPANCTNGTPTWSSQNSAVASVSSDGVIYAHKAGTTFVGATTVNSDGSALTAWAEIIVVDASGIDSAETDSATGVRVEGGVIITGSKAEVYSITGAFVAASVNGKVAGLPRGIYLVRTAGKTVKVRL